MGPTNTFYYKLTTSKLEIRYKFNCTVYSECPSTEFCKNAITDVCELDLNYGDSCENIATDNDDYACKNNNCELDNFDSSGYFCTRDDKCTHDGVGYDNGYELCSGVDWYKLCSYSSWGSQIDCSSGCTSGMEGGCGPDIDVSPTTITFNEVI